MKKRNLLLGVLIFLLALIIIPTSISAQEIQPRGGYCPNCKQMNVHVVPGYTTEWQDYEGDYCIHGYKNGYDMGQLRWVYGAYKQCTCGWKSEQTVKQEGRRVCHGYN